mgnify:CR=1 FL=1
MAKHFASIRLEDVLENLFMTIGIAVVVALIAVALLGIGWLITGKSKLQAGACGRAPDKKRTKECGTQAHCMLCDKDKDKKGDDGVSER